jgi:predicted dinucleotide-binding enzyme
VNPERAPGARLVKTLNQLSVGTLIAPPSDSKGRRAIFVASDHDDARAEVARLIERLDFAPIELGKILAP